MGKSLVVHLRRECVFADLEIFLGFEYGKLGSGWDRLSD